MKRKTIAELEGQIAALRELREGDNQALTKATAVACNKQEDLNRANKRVAEVESDNRRLWQLVQCLTEAIRARS